jgi:arylsulfatase A-like enzyme
VEQPVVPETLAPRYVTESISFFKESIERDVPFFLYLAFSHVHQLCAPRQSECQWASTHFSKNKTGYNATFGDALEEMDWIAGKVLEGLSDLGLEDNTLVVFTSDNGPWVAEGSCAGSKGFFTGKWLAENVDPDCTACPSEYAPSPLPGRPRRCVFPGPNSSIHGVTEVVYETEGIHCGEDSGLGSAWEANVRMPAFVKWPGGKIPKGSKTMEMVTTLDVLPTVLGLLGIEGRSNGIDGVDVSDVFLGKEGAVEKDNRPVFFWRDGFTSGPLPPPFGRFDVVAMKVGNIKAWFYTKSSHYNADAEVFHDPPLLFDVLHDPAESEPLDPEDYSSWIETAKGLLREHKQSVNWTDPLCLARDPRYAPCVDEATNCRTNPPPVWESSA